MSLSKPMESFANASSAAIGGALSTLALYPLDTLKTLAQASSSGAKAEVNGDKVSLTSLYSGVQYKISQSSIAKFLYFYIYSTLSSSVSKDKKISTGIALLLGYLSEGLHLPITIPIEMIATRMQAAKGSKGVMQIIRGILADSGGRFSAFYKGASAYFVLCLQPAIQFTLFEWLKTSTLRQMSKKSASHSLTALQAFLLGALSRAIATIIIFPYIRAKVILQTRSKKVTGEADGISDTIRDIVKVNGVKDLYRGMAPELIKGMLSSALMLMTKERLYAYNVQLLLHLTAVK